MLESVRSLLIVVNFAVIFVACGSTHSAELIPQKKSLNASQPTEAGTWGHLYGARTEWLAQSPPGTVFNVCGDNAAEIISGIKAWSTASGRTDGLSFQESCSRKKSTMIYSFGRDKSTAKEVCKKYPKAVALTFVDSRTIVACDKTDKLPEVMLHEAGHLWGMCDVYPEDVIGSTNCDLNYFTGRSHGSVMGANYKQALSPADISGIAAMIDRKDVVGNFAWRKSDDSGKKIVTLSAIGPADGQTSESDEWSADTVSSLAPPTATDLLIHSRVSCVLE